jgi:hypothetical protein
LIFVAFLAIVSCKKNSYGPSVDPPRQNVTVKFYSTNPVTSYKVITAKVGTVNYGVITYSASQPACSSAWFGAIKLSAGNYTVDYIDKDNQMANRQVAIVVPTGATDCVFFDLK